VVSSYSERDGKSAFIYGVVSEIVSAGVVWLLKSRMGYVKLSVLGFKKTNGNIWRKDGVK
jgi:hypothetical protein